MASGSELEVATPIQVTDDDDNYDIVSIYDLDYDGDVDRELLPRLPRTYSLFLINLGVR